MSKVRWTAGIDKSMKEALEFAALHGFEVDLTTGHHIQFRGHGAIVIGSSSPRNHFAGKQAMSRLRAALRAAGVEAA